MQKILIIKRGLLAIILLLVTINAHAQVPGYMGHRFLLEANLELVPTLSGPTANGNRFFNELALSKSYGLTLNYVRSRRKTISASINYLNTGVMIRTKDANRSSATGFYNLQSYSMAIGGRRYANIAPLGGYFEIAGEVSRLESKLEYYTYVDPTYVSTASNKLNKTFDLGLNLGWGYTNIIKKHLILDFGVKSHFSLIGAIWGAAYLGLDTPEAGLNNASRIRKGYHSFLMFRMSVGYLF